MLGKVASLADINNVAGEIGTALIAAVHLDHSQTLIEILLKAGAEVNIPIRHYPGTALSEALYRGNKHAVEALIRAGADANPRPDTQDMGYNLHLRCAMENHQADEAEALVMMLLYKGTQVNSEDLILACVEGHVNIVRTFLERDIDLRDCVRRVGTPLYRASNFGRVEVVRLLIEMGANVAATNNDGQTALHGAIWGEQVDVVRLLVQKGADLSVADRSGLPPIHHVIQYYNKILVEILVEASDTFPGDDFGRSALFQAILMERYDFFEVLVHKQDPQVCDRFGSTAQSIAVRVGQENMVRWLLTLQNVDITSADCCGRTPLWWARNQHYTHIEKCLLKYAHEHGVDKSIPESELGKPVNFGFGSHCMICRAVGLIFCYKCQSCDDERLMCRECYRLGGRCIDASHMLREFYNSSADDDDFA
ncbi:ankyrin repeat-containing domain protein [Xylariaceae sp. FL1272]|nr:ankyrin repeat-containing domain protein [Xylariaceae sp. FL1272]